MGSMTYSKIEFSSATPDRSSPATSGISTSTTITRSGGSTCPGGGSSGPPSVGVIIRVPALAGIAFMMVRVARRQTMVSIGR